ncbi:relaxase/mobilization nuclease domain-containing protein [Paremcibacter congregatus]|uniref:relaxase/mobilization nuclease domain-containing protein n=1 Tax=Paremcibacter congregatus TaxID=2043170 RepID=UPI0030EEA982
MVNKGDDDFRPKLGRLRDLGRSSGKRYVTRILNAVGKKNARFRGPKHTHGFTGRNIGRGNHAAALRMRGGQARFRQRRVVIKARFIKMVGSGFAKAGAHLRYVQRDGVSKDGEPGQLYGATQDEVDGEKFLEQSKTDRHQFRFIVSPEDAAELDDMKIFTRDLMAQMEKDLDTRLDWVAVDHYNTDNPHTHIVVRGIADDGKDLVIARDYMSSGMRERASALMTDELGPRQDHEITSALRREVTQDRFTSIDRKLLRMAEDGMVDMRRQAPQGYARFNHSLRLGRLAKLQDMQLATEANTGIWHLSKIWKPLYETLECGVISSKLCTRKWPGVADLP